MSEQKYFVDFLQGGDNGQATVDSIQPVTDGEPGTQNVFRRPTENIRGRTEVVRDTARELLYYRDFNHLGLWGAPGNYMTWGGPTDGTPVGTGILTQLGALSVRPLLTPDVSTKGSLSIGTSGTNAVIYAVLPAGYTTQGLDEVTVEHRDVLGATLSATITDGPVKRILVVFDSTQTSHDAVAVASAVNLAIAADSVLNLRFSATADGLLGTAILAQAETRVEGTADQEAHSLSSGVLTTFTTANPLKNGDAVAIYYRYLVEEPITLTPGGRWESNPDRATDTITAASLFITSNEPEKIPGSVPLFKVFNDQIVWFDGTRMEPGTTGPIGSTTSDYVLVDDSVFSGLDSNVNNGGVSNMLTPKSLQEALVSIDTRLRHRRSVTYSITDGVNSTGGYYNSSTALQDAISELAGTGGHIYLRRGTYTIPNVYGIPANVTLEGEGVGLVTINQAAPTSLSVASNCVISGVTISIGTTLLTVSGDNCALSNLVVNGLMSITGQHNVTSDLYISCITSTAVTLAVAGSYNVLSGTRVFNTMTVAGVGNHVTTTRLQVDGIAPASSSVFSCSGTGCVVDGLTVLAPAIPLNAKNLAALAGTSCSYNNISVTGASIPALTNCFGVVVLGVLLKLENISCSMAGGVALNIYNTSSGYLDGGGFINNSTTENTLVYSSISTASPAFSVRNCVFYQTEQTGHRLFDIDATSTDGLQSNLTFEHCVFIAASLSTYAARAETVKFYNCEFRIQNPIVAGSRRLGGQNDGQTSAIFVFNDNCLLQDCSINGYDAEVNNFGGTPSITAPLFVELNNAKASRLRLFTLNRHLNAGSGTGIGLIQLTGNSKLNDLKVEFTSTAAVQAGASALEAIVTLTNAVDAEFTGYKVSSTDVLPTATALGYAPVGSTTQSTRFRMADVNFAPTGGYYGPILPGTIAPLALFYTVERCTFGIPLAGAKDARGAYLPEGNGTLRDITFWAKNVSTAGGFVLGTTHYSVNFDNIRLACNVAVDTTNAYFNGPGSATYETWRFIGCFFYLDALVPLSTKNFLTAGDAFTLSAGAGNINIYTNGTAGNPSFSAVVNIW